MWKMFQEFREFALRGNVIDMAVGIIIGGAFGTVVSSLVKDIVMPPIGLLLNGVDFSEIKLTLDGRAGTPVTLNIGLFLNAVISFLIVAFAVFLLVKTANQIRARFEREKAASPPEPTPTEKLLAEIRDLLKGQAAGK